VPGGTYSRTYTNDGGGPTGEADPATVSPFRLDKYVVTVGRFRPFVAAWAGGSGWTPPPGSGKHTHLNGGQGLLAAGQSSAYETGWVSADDVNIAPTDANLSDATCDPGTGSSTWTSAAGADDDRPVNCLNWYEAYAFCIWDGGFLPSEAEWEYAAAGGAQQREYPWGTTDPGTGSQYAIYGCYYPNGTGTCTGLGNIAPVGTAALGAALWGQLDMAGEMSEWILDYYVSPYAEPCTDCAQLQSAPPRVLRAGDYHFGSTILWPYDRYQGTPTVRGSFFGMRCARAP
jgi:formylglycine-generating enzyme required for sulfatase activity